ncbi:MAG: hypothetical protein Q8L85_03940 [Alphaproteobacteria bacterium]|nr:hypothetical protein [Alphaproteobacteria bacterium]
MFKKSILLLGTFFVLSDVSAMRVFSLAELNNLECSKQQLTVKIEDIANALASTKPSVELEHHEFIVDFVKFATPDNLNENIVSPTDITEEMIKLIERQKEHKYSTRILEKYDEEKRKEEKFIKEVKRFIIFLMTSENFSTEEKIECLEVMCLPIEMKKLTIKLIKEIPVEFLKEYIKKKEAVEESEVLVERNIPHKNSTELLIELLIAQEMFCEACEEQKALELKELSVTSDKQDEHDETTQENIN